MNQIKILFATLFLITTIIQVSYAYEGTTTSSERYRATTPVTDEVKPTERLVDQSPLLPRLNDDYPLKSVSKLSYEEERENAMEAAIRASQKAAGAVEIDSWESVEADVIGHMRAKQYREMMRETPVIESEMEEIVEEVLDEIDLEISVLQKQLEILDLQIEEVRQQCEAELGMPGCVTPQTSPLAA